MKKQLLSLSFALMATLSAQTLYALSITKAEGWLETAHVEWLPVDGAAYYMVCYTGEGFVNEPLDEALIRTYDQFLRADALGLRAGNYQLTIKAFDANGAQLERATSPSLRVDAHKRAGFAFHSNATSFVPGGYAADGTAKPGAQIIYISQASVNQVTCEILNDRGVEVTTTGLANILSARGRGYDKRPLIIRLVGLLKDHQVNNLGVGSNLSFVGLNADTRAIENITLEGVGNDATLYGIGVYMKRSKGIEVRNIGLMLFKDDGVSMEVDNFNNWIHHNDFFYGASGTDSDQVKGDGSIDMKYNTTQITVGFNHFWDSGKTTFAGGATEEHPIYFTYHHNWFDHSDSRHPRLCHATAHIYNNFFDSNPTACILNTETSSAFVEANHFFKSPFPMMINMQGTNYERWPNGTQDGGMTKAYNNKIEGATKLYDQRDRATDFDAYLVAHRDEQLPASVVSRKGGNVYSNFDTSPLMYAYTPDAPEDLRDIVTKYAGRVEGGDFKWHFDQPSDATSNTINEALKLALTNYTSSLLAIQGEVVPEEEDTPEEEFGALIAGGGMCDLLSLGDDSGFAITNGSTTNSRGSVTVNEILYNCCMKIGSSTTITFTTTKPARLNMVFNQSDGNTLELNNGIGIHAIANGRLLLDLPIPATYTVKRKATESYLFYLSLSEMVSTGVDTTPHDASVYLSNGVIYNPENRLIQVLDLSGRVVDAGEGDRSIARFARGIYFVRIVATQQVVKVKW